MRPMIPHEVSRTHPQKLRISQHLNHPDQTDQGPSDREMSDKKKHGLSIHGN